MTTTILTGPRWSTAATICVRQAAYDAMGVDGRPPSPEMERRWMRGRRLGVLMAEEVKASLEAKGHVVHLELPVAWPTDDPIGECHPDIYDETANEVIEVVSSAGAELPPRKPVQAAGCAIRLGATCRILAVDPKSNEERVYPVNVPAFADEVSRIERAMVAAVRERVVPDRPEGMSPGAWPCIECGHAARCFADWTPPPAGRLPGAEEDFMRLADIERQSAESKRTAKALESEREEIRARIAGRMEPGVDYIEAGVKVRRSEVAGRRSLSFSALEAAGYSLPAEVAEFVSEGKPYERWTVKDLER